MLWPWWEGIRWVLSKNPNDFPNDLQSLPSAGLLASERIPRARKSERALDARGERPGVQWELNTNEVDDNQGGYQDETALIELVTLVGLDGLLSRCGGLDGRLDQVRCRRGHPQFCRHGVRSFLLGNVNDYCGRESSTRDLHLLFSMKQQGEECARALNFAVR